MVELYIAFNIDMTVGLICAEVELAYKLILV